MPKINWLHAPRLTASICLAFIFLACSDGSGPDPIDENSIEGQITALFPAGPTLRDAAMTRVASVRQALAQNNSATAKSQALGLVDLTLTSLRAGTLTGGQVAPTRAAASRLVDAIYQLVSLEQPKIPDAALTDDGAAKIIGPSGGTVVTPNGGAGVQFPAGTLPSEVLVTIVRIPSTPTPGTGPLPTTLKQYPPYYDFATTPVVVFSDSARVGICQVTNPSSPFYPPEPHDRLRLAHPVGPGAQSTLEILDRVSVDDIVRCTSVSAYAPNFDAQFGWRGALASIVDGALNLVRPTELFAAHGGLGGKTKSFSPFGAVDPLSGPVATISIASSTTTVNAGRSIDLTAVLKDASDNVLPGRTVAWSSSDTALATISATGVVAPVVGIFGGGSVTITATSEGKTATTTITVVRAPNAPNRVPGSPIASFDLGESNGCALNGNGNAFCWGSNTFGQLGDGTTVPKSSPTAVVMPAGVSFTSISTGGRSFGSDAHTCALTPQGIAYCWGATQSGIGDGTNSRWSVPTQVSMPSGVTFTSISTGAEHTCALTAASIAYCWGSQNVFGVIGDGATLTNRLSPVPVVMPAGVTFSSISAGYFNTCAIGSDGAAYCWGINDPYGAVGDGTTTTRSIPTRVVMPAGVSFTKITTGWLYSCALSSTGIAYCWGSNSSGRLGSGQPTSDNALVPVSVVMPAGVAFTSIAASNTHTCALATNGVAYCWGDNAGTNQLATGPGGLGDGTIISRLVPTPVLMPIGVTFNTLSVGTSFGCGTSAAGVRYCWGNNSIGQRGDGTTTP